MHILNVFPMFIASLLEQNALFQAHLQVATPLTSAHHKIKLLVFLTYTVGIHFGSLNTVPLGLK